MKHFILIKSGAKRGLYFRDAAGILTLTEGQPPEGVAQIIPSCVNNMGQEIYLAVYEEEPSLFLGYSKYTMNMSISMEAFYALQCFRIRVDLIDMARHDKGDSPVYLKCLGTIENLFLRGVAWQKWL